MPTHTPQVYWLPCTRLCARTQTHIFMYSTLTCLHNTLRKHFFLNLTELLLIAVHYIHIVHYHTFHAHLDSSQTAKQTNSSTTHKKHSHSHPHKHPPPSPPHKQTYPQHTLVCTDPPEHHFMYADRSPHSVHEHKHSDSMANSLTQSSQGWPQDTMPRTFWKWSSVRANTTSMCEQAHLSALRGRGRAVPQDSFSLAEQQNHSHGKFHITMYLKTKSAHPPTSSLCSHHLSLPPTLPLHPPPSRGKNVLPQA